MNDIALISHNIKQLQAITNIFCSFLKLNSIKCNKKTSDLITNLKTNNSLRKQSLIVEGESITPKLYKESIKYLGIYLSGYSLSYSTKLKLKKKILNFS